MQTDRKIYVVAVEHSGDLLGADLVRSLRAQGDGALEIVGTGGHAMAAEGVSSPIDISGMSILGLFEGIKAYGRVKAKVAETVAHILAAKPDTVVLIDSWGFMLRVAQGVREADPAIKLVKYVGPQVWATRPGRAKTLAGAVDHLLSIMPMDLPHYETLGLPATYVGNPHLERLQPGDGAAFRACHEIGADEIVIQVLLGSRPAEIKRLYEPFLDAVALTRAHESQPRLVFGIAENLAEELEPRLKADPRATGAILVGEEDKDDAFAASDLSLACSGTVTTELATAGVPAVVGYRLGAPTYWLARLTGLYKPRFISIVNIMTDEGLLPEFLQMDCTAENLAGAVNDLLEDPERRDYVSRRLREATDEMRGEGHASDKAAEVILSSQINPVLASTR